MSEVIREAGIGAVTKHKVEGDEKECDCWIKKDTVCSTRQT